jgi:hypothetical protein
MKNEKCKFKNAICILLFSFFNEVEENAKGYNISFAMIAKCHRYFANIKTDTVYELYQ